MTDKLKCIVVDDEELARVLLQNYIERLPNLEIKGLCANPLEALNLMQKETIDILFLDIQMPDITGIEFLNTLSSKPMVIFTTAYKEYALQGYDLDIVDYLLKPFRFERFLKAVNKAVLKHQSNNSLEITATETSPPQESNASKDYLLVKSEFITYKLMLSDILYIKSMREYVAYYTKEKRILSLGSLKGLINELPTDQFLRIHKSYIINTAFVSALEGNMIHIQGEKLPVGGSYREDVKKKIF